MNQDAITCYQQSMANSLEKWICAKEKPETMNDYPVIERLFVRYKDAGCGGRWERTVILPEEKKRSVYHYKDPSPNLI